MVFEMKCEVCAQGPQQGTTVYRTGGKGPGVNPHWRCQFHIEAATAVDADVLELAAVIESDGVSVQ